jgi:heme-degrading monooxygenase HmoA
MIVRAWRGYAAASNPEGYPEHFRRRVVPELRGVDGFLGATLIRQVRADEIVYMVLTRWRSMEMVTAFAGDDVGKAVVEPGAVAVLSRFDDRVEHYEAVEEVAPA